VTTPAEPDPPQPRDIAVEQPTPDQLADLEQRSDSGDRTGSRPAPEQG
jgi:hypothetical protein